MCHYSYAYGCDVPCCHQQRGQQVSLPFSPCSLGLLLLPMSEVCIPLLLCQSATGEPLCMGVIELSKDLIEERTRGSESSSLDMPRCVCWLHYELSCRMGHRCNQLHVNRMFTQVLLHHAKSQPRCCAMHGDTIGILPPGLLGKYVQVGRTQVSGGRFLATRYWQKNNIRRINIRNLCKLHQEGRCKFATECKFVHICQELYSEILEGDPICQLEQVLRAMRAGACIEPNPQERSIEELKKQKKIPGRPATPPSPAPDP